MIYFYVLLIIVLAVFDIIAIKKKGKKKDIIVYLSLMTLVAVFGGIYLSDKYRPSIASYILMFANIKE